MNTNSWIVIKVSVVCVVIFIASLIFTACGSGPQFPLDDSYRGSSDIAQEYAEGLAEKAELEARMADDPCLEDTISGIPVDSPYSRCNDKVNYDVLDDPGPPDDYYESDSPSQSEARSKSGDNWYQAKDHIGENATVCGPVMGAVYDVNGEGQPTFINIGNDYPNPDRFTVVIWGKYRSNFPSPPEIAYQSGTWCFTGTIEMFEGVPEIEITNLQQVSRTNTGGIDFSRLNAISATQDASSGTIDIDLLNSLSNPCVTSDSKNVPVKCKEWLQCNYFWVYSYSQGEWICEVYYEPPGPCDGFDQGDCEGPDPFDPDD